MSLFEALIEKDPFRQGDRFMGLNQVQIEVNQTQAQQLRLLGWRYQLADLVAPLLVGAKDLLNLLVDLENG